MLKQMLPAAERRERILLAPGSHIGRLTECFLIPCTTRPIVLPPSKDIHSFERRLKDRPGSALFELFFFCRRLPDGSDPFVRLPLLSFGRLRRPPLPFLRAILIRNHLLHGSAPFRSPQPGSALSVFLHEDCGDL